MGVILDDEVVGTDPGHVQDRGRIEVMRAVDIRAKISALSRGGIVEPKNRLIRSIIPAFAVSFIFAGAVVADTFEFVSFTPPTGWSHSATQGERVYLRPTGIGLIKFYAGRAATGSAAEEFSRSWHANLDSTIPGPPPQPTIQRDGVHSVAVGVRQIDAQGTITTVTLVTFVGQGRSLSILAMGAGDAVMREITTFLDTLKIIPAADAASSSSPAITIDLKVPPGYVSEPNGSGLVFRPKTMDRSTPCIYGVSAARVSRGSLDADARAAILENLPGWQVKSDHFDAMRGISTDGWPYFWFRTDVQRLAGSQFEYLSAMTMAVPDARGRVNIVWGFGAVGICQLDDAAFLTLFHSLRIQGSTQDGGKAIARELIGTWRNSQRVGIAQYKFLPNGRYEFGIGSVTRMGTLERTSASASDGSWSIVGSQLVITPDARSRGAMKYLVRVYDKYFQGSWNRRMALFEAGPVPAGEIEYDRIEVR